jgi:hypothetical protein
MKDLSLDLPTLNQNASNDTTAAAAHTGRVRGLGAAITALATMVASACGGASEASEPTDTAKPPTTPASTIETTVPPTTIDSTTTITVETTTTDAATTTEPSAPIGSPSTETPTTIGVDNSADKFNLAPNSIANKLTITWLLIAGVRPVDNGDGTYSFDTTAERSALSPSDVPESLVASIAGPSRQLFFDQLATSETYGVENFYVLADTAQNATPIAVTSTEVSIVASSLPEANSQAMNSWASQMDQLGNAYVSEICADYVTLNADGTRELSRSVWAVLNTVDPATGEEFIALSMPYLGQDAGTAVSPVSGLRC